MAQKKEVYGEIHSAIKILELHFHRLILLLEWNIWTHVIISDVEIYFG